MPGLEIPASLNRDQLLRSTKITSRQLSAWERKGLFAAKERYEPRDLLLISNLKTLRRAGFHAADVESLASALKRRFGHNTVPLEDFRLRPHGKRLAVHWEGREMEAQSGQLLLDLAPAELEIIRSFPAPSVAAKQSAENIRKQEAADAFFKALERENQGAPSSEVIPLYREALALDSQCFGAHLNLGTLYFNQKNLKQAEQHYRAAIELHPRYVLAHFNLASLYDELGNFQKAVDLYRSTLALDPDYVDAHYNLALLLQNMGRLMEATRHWKRFLKLDPKGEWANIARRELQRLLDTTVLAGGSPKPPVNGGVRSGASQVG